MKPKVFTGWITADRDIREQFFWTPPDLYYGPAHFEIGYIYKRRKDIKGPAKKIIITVEEE